MLFLAACSLAAQPTASADPPGAYELLGEVRRAYAGLGSYRDIGEIRKIVDPGGAGERELKMWFETAASAGAGMRFDLWTIGDWESSQWVLWSDGEKAHLFDGRLGQYKPAPSPAAELVSRFGRGGLEALVVPRLLLGDREALAEPEAAAVDGPESCRPDEETGDGCWRLTLSRMAGTISSRLWVDRESRLIARIEVELAATGAALDEALAQAELDRRGGFSEPATTIRAYHQLEPGDEPVTAARLAFTPPPGARQVESWEVAQEPAAGAAVDPELGFFDEITVALHTLAVRLVDSRGDPILGLGPDDLVARVGDREIPVTALDWVASGGGGDPAPRGGDGKVERPGTLAAVPRLPETLATPEPGQLVVLFVQADFEPTIARGHLRLLPSLEELVGNLPAGDRVAVVSFYRSLRFWQDFTRDRDAVVATLKRTVMPGARPLVRRSSHAAPGQSLLDNVDFRRADRAASPEEALAVVADALVPLAGEKVVIYVGWAWGELRGGAGVAMTPDYRDALSALDAARASVFVLDVTEADWHALEAGLQGVAEDTGGTYLRTFRSASVAAHKLGRILSGHYLVTIDRSDLPETRGRLRLELRGRKGEALYKPIVLR